MFDWFSTLFKDNKPRNMSPGSSQVGEIDPETGLPLSEYQDLGRIQGRNEGTGEGWPSMTKKDYGDLGRAFQAQQVQSPTLIGGGINAGFDQNWLGEQTNTGSANGAKIS